MNDKGSPIIEWNSPISYKLKLPKNITIHPIFNISKLCQSLGS